MMTEKQYLILQYENTTFAREMQAADDLSALYHKEQGDGIQIVADLIFATDEMEAVDLYQQQPINAWQLANFLTYGLIFVAVAALINGYLIASTISTLVILLRIAQHSLFSPQDNMERYQSDALRLLIDANYIPSLRKEDIQMSPATKIVIGFGVVLLLGVLGLIAYVKQQGYL